MSELFNNLEGIVSVIVLLIGVGMAYNKIISRIENNRAMINQRIDFIQEQVDAIDRKNEDITTVLIDIKVSISTLKTDIAHILKALERE
jgi:F0F1-type ATP synthase membrane subunit b/b'